MIATLKRRDFITLLSGAAAAWPLAAGAQQFNKSIRLGFLGPTLNTPPAVEQYEAFRTQLAELGLRDGQNVTIDYKGADQDCDPYMARDQTRFHLATSVRLCVVP
jgi:putative ABC transport system substrate-binding protein